MNILKRLFALFLVMISVLVLSACGSNQKELPPKTESTQKAAPSVPTPAKLVEKTLLKIEAEKAKGASIKSQTILSGSSSIPSIQNLLQKPINIKLDVQATKKFTNLQTLFNVGSTAFEFEYLEKGNKGLWKYENNWYNIPPDSDESEKEADEPDPDPDGKMLFSLLPSMLDGTVTQDNYQGKKVWLYSGGFKKEGLLAYEKKTKALKNLPTVVDKETSKAIEFVAKSTKFDLIVDQADNSLQAVTINMKTTGTELSTLFPELAELKFQEINLTSTIEIAELFKTNPDIVLPKAYGTGDQFGQAVLPKVLPLIAPLVSDGVIKPNQN